MIAIECDLVVFAFHSAPPTPNVTTRHSLYMEFLLYTFDGSYSFGFRFVDIEKQLPHMAMFKYLNLILENYKDCTAVSINGTTTYDDSMVDRGKKENCCVTKLWLFHFFPAFSAKEKNDNAAKRNIEKTRNNLIIEKNELFIHLCVFCIHKTIETDRENERNSPILCPMRIKYFEEEKKIPTKMRDIKNSTFIKWKD